MNADILAHGLPGLLGPVWRLSPPYEIEPIAGGMNSVVVGVALPVARYVAKWVPEVDRAALNAGARAAQIITRGGLAAGEPVLTRDGSITVDFAGGVVALLSYVPGTPCNPRLAISFCLVRPWRGPTRLPVRRSAGDRCSPSWSTQRRRDQRWNPGCGWPWLQFRPSTGRCRR